MSNLLVQHTCRAYTPLTNYPQHPTLNIHILFTSLLLWLVLSPAPTLELSRQIRPIRPSPVRRLALCFCLPLGQLASPFAERTNRALFLRHSVSIKFKVHHTMRIFLSPHPDLLGRISSRQLSCRQEGDMSPMDILAQRHASNAAYC